MSGETRELPLATSQLLAELQLEDFEAGFRRLGAQTVEDLALVRYEELLEMGLSKVQCHLFFAKVSSFAVSANRPWVVEEALEGADGVLRTPGGQEIVLSGQGERQSPDSRDQDAVDGDLLELGERGLLDASEYEVPHGREGKSLLRRLMPPPMGSPPVDVYSSRKRAHSSHLSTAAARGSERPTGSSVSATDSSSSSPVVDVRPRKRARADRRPRLDGEHVLDERLLHCHGRLLSPSRDELSNKGL